MNPYTPLRRQLQAIAFEVSTMLQEAIVLELAQAGALRDTLVPAEEEKTAAAADRSAPKPRGRPRKPRLEAPPQSPTWTPANMLPGLPEDLDHPLNTSPESPAQVSNPSRVGNTHGTHPKKIYPWDRL